MDLEMEKQEEKEANPRWLELLLLERKVVRKGRRKMTPYKESGDGSHHLRLLLGLNIDFRASDGFDEEGRIVRRNF